MRQTSPQFFALPSDIYDALFSSQLKFKMSRLREIALSKGLIVSPLLSREELCMRLARLPYSYNEFLELSESLKVDSRKPKSEPTNLDTCISGEQIQSVLDKVKERFPNDAINITQRDSGKTIIKSEYDEIDHGQTRLKQRIPKEVTIEIKATDDGSGTKILSSATEHTQAIVAELISLIEKEDDLTITPSHIDLSVFTTTQRNQFFIALANTLPDIKFVTAVTVKVQRGDDEIEGEEDTQNAEDGFLSKINSASLTGYNILESSQVKEFLDGNEYFIHTLRWETDEVRVDQTNGATLLIEIKATPTAECSNFQFDIVGHKHRSKVNNEFVKNFSPITSFAKIPFIEVIHKRAFEVYQEIYNEIPLDQR